MAEKKVPVKRNTKSGRPTTYNPKRAKELLDIMSTGASKMEAAAKLKIARGTLYKWANDHKDFAEALQKGVEWAEAKNAEIIKAIALGQIPKANVAAYQMYMRNTAGWDKNIGDGVSNQTINIGNMNVLQNKSTEELLEFISTTKDELRDIIDVECLEVIESENKD